MISLQNQLIIMSVLSGIGIGVIVLSIAWAYSWRYYVSR